MKRKIRVSTDRGVVIEATINTKNLTRQEVEMARDDLADSLLKVAADVRYLSSPLNRVRVQ